MGDELYRLNLVSDFLTETCTDQMKPSWVVMCALQMDFRRQKRTFIDMDPAVLQETPQPNPEMNPEETSSILHTTCNGSAAEMYIKSFLPSIGDVDVTRFRNNEIADFGDTPSVEDNVDMHGLHEVVNFFKLEHAPCCPGYVHLVENGELRYALERNEYKHMPSQPPQDRANVVHETGPGPAATSDQPASPELQEWMYDCGKLSLSFDDVHATRCLSWPCRSDFGKRERCSEGWPTEEIIEKVIQGACDVVPARHPDCKENERQWRLSFSRAEVILMNSLSSTQQLVFSLLKYFLKKQLLIGTEDKLLSTYHLKTLMLWTCEEKPASWWTSPCILICWKLLKTFRQWVRRKRCSNYFMSEINLFDSEKFKTNFKNILQKMDNNFTRDINTIHELTSWFWRSCEDRARMIFKSLPISDDYKFEEAKSLAQEYVTKFQTVRLNFLSSVFGIIDMIDVELDELNTHKLKNILQELHRVDIRLVVWFKANAYLRVLVDLYTMGWDQILGRLHIIDFLVTLATKPSRGSSCFLNSFCSATSLKKRYSLKFRELEERCQEVCSWPEQCLLDKLKDELSEFFLDFKSDPETSSRKRRMEFQDCTSSSKRGKEHFEDGTIHIQSRNALQLNLNSSENSIKSRSDSQIENKQSRKIVFTQGEELFEILFKLSIKCYTKCHKQMIVDKDLKDTNFVSLHYEALYWFRIKQYEEVLDLHKRTYEVLNTNFPSKKTFNQEHVSSFCISTSHKTALLLNDDLVMAMGLILLCNREFINQVHKLAFLYVTPKYFIDYLRILSLMKLERSKSDIIDAFKPMVFTAKGLSLAMENISFLFLWRRIKYCYIFFVAPIICMVCNAEDN